VRVGLAALGRTNCIMIGICLGRRRTDGARNRYCIGLSGAYSFGLVDMNTGPVNGARSTLPVVLSKTQRLSLSIMM
jgi:hypothetical protein